MTDGDEGSVESGARAWGTKACPRPSAEGRAANSRLPYRAARRGLYHHHGGLVASRGCEVHQRPAAYAGDRQGVG